MAQEWSDVYYGKILQVLEVNDDSRFADLIKKTQAVLEDEGKASAERWARILAGLLISEGGGGRTEWAAADVTRSEVVDAIFDAVEFGMERLELNGDPEFYEDLHADWVLPNGDEDPRVAPETGGVDVSLAEQLEAEELARQQEADEERAENILHMAARNLDLIGDTRYDAEISHLINLAVQDDPGLIAVAERLARQIAADRGTDAGPQGERFVAQMRTRLADQALEAAAAWADPESPAFPNLGVAESVLTFGDETDSADGTQPGFAPGGGGGDDSDGGSDGGHGPDRPGNGEVPRRPASSHYEPPNFRRQMDAQTEPELQDVEDVVAAREASERARRAAHGEALDIAKIVEFLKDDDKEGAKSHATRAANEMRVAGDSAEPTGAIAKRLLAEAVARYKDERQEAETARALPDVIWDDPGMLRAGMRFTQAYTSGDVAAARKALARALALARRLADTHDLLDEIDAARILDNFLPARADRDIDGPEDALRRGLEEIDTAVRADERRQAEEARTEDVRADASAETAARRAEFMARDADSYTASDLDEFDLSEHIRTQLGLILRALQASDTATARGLALALEERLEGITGRYGNMKAAAILKMMLNKRNDLERVVAKPAPKPIAVSSGKAGQTMADAKSAAPETQEKEDDDTETVVSGAGSVDGPTDTNRHDDDEPPAAGAALTVKLISKVDWANFVEVYSLPPEEIEALKEIATKIVRKGMGTTPVVYAGKELLARARKAKSGARFKNGIHVAAAVEDALSRRAENRKLTRSLKASDIPDDEEIAA